MFTGTRCVNRRCAQRVTLWQRPGSSQDWEQLTKDTSVEEEASLAWVSY